MHNMFIFPSVFESETLTPSFFKGFVTQKEKGRKRTGYISAFLWGGSVSQLTTVPHIVAPAYIQNSDVER